MFLEEIRINESRFRDVLKLSIDTLLVLHLLVLQLGMERLQQEGTQEVNPRCSDAL